MPHTGEPSQRSYCASVGPRHFVSPAQSEESLLALRREKQSKRHGEGGVRSDAPPPLVFLSTSINAGSWVGGASLQLNVRPAYFVAHLREGKQGDEVDQILCGRNKQHRALRQME